jgi:hypothetical protein
MPKPVQLTLMASAAVTASGSSAAVVVAPSPDDGAIRRAAVVLVDVTDLDGMLQVSLQTSPSGSSWRTVAEFGSFVRAQYARLSVTPLERYLRVVWTLSGASATFGVTAGADIILADLEDFWRWGLPARAVEDVEPADAVSHCLLAASDLGYGSVPSRWRRKLSHPYPPALRQKVCELAAGEVLTVRGYDPDDAADQAIAKRAGAAQEWFERLSNGALIPPWVDDEDEDTEPPAGAYAVAGDSLRDW